MSKSHSSQSSCEDVVEEEAGTSAAPTRMMGGDADCVAVTEAVWTCVAVAEGVCACDGVGVAVAEAVADWLAVGLALWQ